MVARDDAAMVARDAATAPARHQVRLGLYTHTDAPPTQPPARAAAAAPDDTP